MSFVISFIKDQIATVFDDVGNKKNKLPSSHNKWANVCTNLINLMLNDFQRNCLFSYRPTVIVSLIKQFLCPKAIFIAGYAFLAIQSYNFYAYLMFSMSR